MSSSVLLDTCALSYLRLPKKYPEVVEYVATRQYVYASAATYYELSKGYFSQGFVERPLSKEIQRFYSDLVSEKVLTVIPIDRGTAELWGILNAAAVSYPDEPRNCGQECPRTRRHRKAERLLLDMLVAATSLAHGLPIVTSNIIDFMSISEFAQLPGLYDPVTCKWHIPPAETRAFKCKFGEGTRFELEPNASGAGCAVPSADRRQQPVAMPAVF